MASDLVKKLDALVKKKSKISLKAAMIILKEKEDKLSEAAMKLSDEFSIEKKGGKISQIIYTKQPNVKEIISELLKIIKKLKDPEFKETKKTLLSFIVFLEKKQYIDNEAKVKKAVDDYSLEINDYINAFCELKNAKKESNYYSESVESFSKKIDDDTKAMNECSKSLNCALELMRKAYNELGKQRDKNKSAANNLNILILGEKISHKSILDLLGIRRILPEKKEEPKEKPNEAKPEENNTGVEKSAEKENEFMPHKEASPIKTGAVKVSEKFSTEVDELLKLAKEEGTVSFKKLSALYEEKTETIENWCEALEETGLISIHYPLFGSPYIKYEKKEREE